MTMPGKIYWGPGHLPDSFDFGPGTAALMIVRHAARIPVITVADAYTAHLTEEGKAMAHAFGVELGRRVKIGAAVSSPVGRCVETAQQILMGTQNGSGNTIPVQPLPVLHFEQKLTGILGLENVYLNDPGFLHLVSHPDSREYALLRQALLETLPFSAVPGVISLAVTHDVLVTFLRACLLGLPSAALSDFPGFLEGLILLKAGDRISLL